MKRVLQYLRRQAVCSLCGLLLLPAGASALSLVTVTRGLSHPVFLTQPPGETQRLFVVEQTGRIRILLNHRLVQRPFLDIAHKIVYGGERGLLGLAFHPDYARNGRFFVDYIRRGDGATVVAEYRVSGDPDSAAPAERILLVVPQPYTNHKGGMLAFGPDANLYIALGDGGSEYDPRHIGQNRNTLLAKILRIDVDHGTPYAIPADNPWAHGSGRPEMYAWGLRNPWRFSFDRATGQLWTGDVGQDKWEEVDIIHKGGNYGWSVMEGNHCFRPARGCERPGLIRPVAEYSHSGGRCAIIGGYVYRGQEIPALAGTYLFGDYCSGEIFGLSRRGRALLLRSPLRISSFGEDQAGNVYVLGLSGQVARLAP